MGNTKEPIPTLSSPQQTAPTHATAPRTMHFALFITGSLWLLASMTISARAAQGIAERFNLTVAAALLEQLFLLFLLLVGFSLFQGILRRSGDLRTTNALPQRSTTRQEFLRGIALGWGMLLVAVLPMMLTGSLHLQFWLEPRAWGLTILSLLTLAVATLALEVAFRGFLYIRLISAFGVVTATVVLSLIYAVLSSFRPNATGLSIVLTFFLGLLFSLAYLRTHALWVGWGLHFGWAAATAVLLGLPLGGFSTYSEIVTTTAIGRNWITGGNYGPEGAAFTILVLWAGIAVLYRMTRNYAWEYTHAPIVPAGYAVVVAPPAAHTAMENAAAAAPAPLVQILGSTPTAPSTMAAIEEHLRRESDTSGS